MGVFSVVDDKFVPVYRVMWVSKTPHFCGEEDCEREGSYEIRLEQDESVWAKLSERDEMLLAIERWHAGVEDEDFEDDEEPPA